MKNVNVLLVHKGLSSFVKIDYEILKKEFNVDIFYLDPSKKIIPFLYYHVKFFFYMVSYIRRYDVIISWFGDYHSFHAGLFSRIFNKKFITIIAGYDAVSIPYIRFGLFYKNRLRQKLVLKAYKWSDKILSVDESLILGKNSYVSGKNVIGILNFDSRLKTKTNVITFGYDPDFWKCKKAEKKKQILTVGLADNDQIAIRKGFDLMVEVSKKLPEYEFVFIGIKKESISIDYRGIPNLIVLEKVTQTELINYYCESKVFAQFSISEGLPNTLCESMLCECVAVGSNVNGIPAVIHNPEFILKEKDVDKAVEIILKALNADSSIGKENREFIMKCYGKEMRERLLIKTVKSLLLY